MQVLDELALEISALEPCPERDELERTMDCCKELSYGLEEGLIGTEEGEDGELRFFPL